MAAEPFTSIGIRPGAPTIKLELSIKEARYFVEALNLAADDMDKTLPDADSTIGFDSLSEDVKRRVRACMILGGCAGIIKSQIDKFDESIPHN